MNLVWTHCNVHPTPTYVFVRTHASSVISIHQRVGQWGKMTVDLVRKSSRSTTCMFESPFVVAELKAR